MRLLRMFVKGHYVTRLGSRRDLSGEKKESALWLKLVDPDEVEEEHFEVYEEVLRGLR